MRKLLLSLCTFSLFALLSPALFGQDAANKYDLLFLSGTVHTASNVTDPLSFRMKADELVNGKYYRIVQFFNIPSDQEKQELKNNGIELLGYLPNFSYFAAIDQQVIFSAENTRGIIRAVLPIAAEYKIHPSLINGAVPDNAEIISGKADLTFTYFKGIPASFIISELKSKIKDIKILEQDDFAQWVIIRVKKEQVASLAQLSFTAYVEPVVPWEVENSSGTTLDRSNTINTYLGGGLKYDGAGVGVSVGDGDYFWYHVDFTGRQTGAVTVATGTNNDHPTHVTGIAGGAGNINPRYRGHASGAHFVSKSGYADISSTTAITALFNGTDSVRVTQHSLGQTCNGGYDANARQSDLEVDALPSLFSVHSAGNSGGTDCGMGAGTSFGQITGGYKMGKNCITTGNLTYADAIASSSSRGPAKDGRIKPDICAKGTSVQSTMPNNLYGSMTGTSMSSPGASGCFAQLIQAYRYMNANADPKLAQLKCIVLNTAEDLGNAGPDYTYGWGRINVWKAYNAIKEQRYFSSSVANGASNTHTVSVPANVKELRVMAYWADPAAASGVAKALINDLDITLSNGTTYDPWLLSTTLTAAELGKPAAKGLDRTNNMEQVAVTNPAPGTYTLTVNGFQVPQGPQEYWVTYEYIMDEIKVTYPIGGESFVPTEVEYIRWDAYGTTGTFTVEYSTNGGAIWTILSSSVAGTARYYSWTVPNTLTGKALVRVSRNSITGKSDANFNIISVPTNLKVDWRCPTSFQLSWNAVTGATNYEVYLLGQKYMESQGKTSGTSFAFSSPNTSVTWASVRALSNNDSVVGRRAIAIQVGTAITACLTGIDGVHTAPYTISVYPNPMNESSNVSVSLREGEEISIKIMDVCGKEISVLADGKLDAGEHMFQVSNLPSSGIYFVSIKGQNGTAVQKIIVAKE